MADQPVRVAYFYVTKWGCHAEFIDLFMKNHWPILREQKKAGRFLDVTFEVPRFHGEGRADWDIMTIITYMDWAALEAHSEGEIAARLYPDQATFKAEEARRFELLVSHWDTVLETIVLPE